MNERMSGEKREKDGERVCEGENETQTVAKNH